MVQEMTTPSPEIVRANGKPQTFHGTSPADSSSRNSTELKSRAERHTGDTAEGKRESVDGEQPTLDEEDPPVDQIQVGVAIILVLSYNHLNNAICSSELAPTSLLLVSLP